MQDESQVWASVGPDTFRDMTSYSLAYRFKCFERKSCLYLQRNVEMKRRIFEPGRYAVIEGLRKIRGEDIYNIT
jgi:hypothetical protein